MTVNGEPVLLYEMQSTGDGLYFSFDALNANDVITIAGTFYCANQNIQYVINETKFVWSGSKWEKYVEYTTYEIGSLILADGCAANALYLRRADGGELAVNNWDDRFYFLAGSGYGLKINDNNLPSEDIKSPNNTIYIGLGLKAKEGDVFTIGGTLYSVAAKTKYVITESTFVYNGSAWENKIDLVKAEKKAALDEYRTTFADADYYEAEVNALNAIVEEGKQNIDAAMTEEAANEAFEAAKAALDEVVTKTEHDEVFPQVQADAKTELRAYKSESDYLAEDWAQIQAIVDAALVEIDECESVTLIKKIVAKAEAEIDEVKTAAERDADEQFAETAKADLEAYKSESDYKEAEWVMIQEIIVNAKVQIDELIGYEEQINEVVAKAKAEMDAVKTAAQVDADEAFAETAKTELDGYKNESDYREKEWTQIQEIISNAKADIDNNLGNEDQIKAIVAAAKVEMDKVLLSDDAIAADFAAMKENAKEEVRANYMGLDFTQYTDEAAAKLYGYVEEALAAIDVATTEAEINAAVSQYKANVNSVEKIKKQESSKDEEESSGCSGAIGAGLAAGSVMVAAVAMALRKKKED